MSTTPLQPAAGCSLYDAGEEWDAIRVPRTVGLAAMAILGTRCGAVVEDPLSTAVCFFTRVGTADAWEVENTRGLGYGHSVTIPPARRTQGPGPHWRMCPGEGSWLTDPDALRAAIEDAFGPRVGSERAREASA